MKNRHLRYTIIGLTDHLSKTWTVSVGQCLESSVWRVVSGGQCLEVSVWRAVSGGQCLEDSVWRAVSGG